MIKKIIYLLLVIFSSFALISCSSPDSPTKDFAIEQPVWENTDLYYEKAASDLRILHISDIHYYAKSLTDQGEKYNLLMNNLAGLDLVHEDELLDKFIDKVVSEGPDALVISGDLTLNGEKDSHKELIEKLDNIRKHDIKILVIPGNHDINSPFARKVFDSGVSDAENVSPEEFEELYKAYGYGDALYKDPNSLSYVAEISANCWALMLDTCIYKDGNVMTGGNINYESRQWIYQILDVASEKGINVFSSSHHSLLVHNEFFIDDYVLMNPQSFVEALENYGVKINLSGHMHCKNIASDGRFCDAAIESMSVWPHLYGQLDIKNDGSYIYNTYSVSTDFDSYQYLYKAAVNTLGKRIDELIAPADAKEAMKALIVEIHVEYFSDSLKDAEYYLANPAYEYFNQYDTDGFGLSYINSIVQQ